MAATPRRKGVPWTIVLVLLTSALFERAHTVCPSGCACDDENLHVNCVDANLDFVPITLNPLVQKLLLKSNRIRSVESGFAFYHELNFIDLSHNHLLKISQGSFSTQTKLNELHLNNNKITFLSNQTFGGGSGNNRGLPSLIHLNLRVNLLENIEPGIFMYTRNLKELDLGENGIGEINSSAFLGLDNLRILRLNRNELRSVPQIFSNGTSPWPQFPVNSGSISGRVSLTQLLELYIGMNPIDSLGRNAFTALINLAVLDLKGCHLNSIDPEAFRGLSQLRKLILSDNNLKAVPSLAFPPLRHLETLKIGRNPISKFDAYAFSALRALHVCEMGGAPELESVDVATFVSNLDLEVIEISSAKKLRALPPKLFKGMSSLRNLILKENALVSLPEDLANWQSLRVLRLEGNPFHCSCDLLWLRDLLSLSKFKNSSFLVLCDEPKEVHDKRIGSLSEDDLDCYLNGPMQKTLLGVSISVVIILLAVFFFLLYHFHDRIQNSCKRNCFRRGRISGPRKSHQGSSASTVKVSDHDASTKTSFLSDLAYPYSDEEYNLRASLMSPSPQPPSGHSKLNGGVQGTRDSMGVPYSTHSLNPNSLERQIHYQHYPTQSLLRPHFHYQTHGPPYVHGHPNGTLPLPHYLDPEYETPVNLGIGGDPYMANSHHYASPMMNDINGQQPSHFPNVHYSNSQVKPIPVTEL